MFFYFFFSRDPLSQNYFPLPAGINKRPSIKPQCVENNLVMTGPQKKTFSRKYGIICIAIYRMIPDEESGIRNGNVRVSVKVGSCAS